MSALPPTKPYLVRAIYDWCVDNGFTPHIMVAVDATTRVPQAYVRNGQIVLNIAPYATNQLTIANDALTCQARFNGAVQALFVPIPNILAIYARENEQGLAFEPGDSGGRAMSLLSQEDVETELGIPAFVSDSEVSAEIGVDESAATPPAELPPDDEPPQPTSPSGRPHLRVVK